MANTTEPNAQNSELDPEAHPSGARIEQMIADQKADTKMEQGDQQNVNRSSTSSDETGTVPQHRRGEHYVSPEEPAEGNRDLDDSSIEAPHRMDADDRTKR